MNLGYHTKMIQKVTYLCCFFLYYAYLRYLLMLVWYVSQRVLSFLRSSLWSISRLTRSRIDLDSLMIFANLSGATAFLITKGHI